MSQPSNDIGNMKSSARYDRYNLGLIYFLSVILFGYITYYSVNFSDLLAR